MRNVTFIAAVVLAVLAFDQVANDGRIADSLHRNLIGYGRQPARAADMAMSFLEFRRD
jgi:hypothetical protein